MINKGCRSGSIYRSSVCNELGNIDDLFSNDDNIIEYTDVL
jgi:hypothetical protein